MVDRNNPCQGNFRGVDTFKMEVMEMRDTTVDFDHSFLNQNKFRNFVEIKSRMNSILLGSLNL